MAETGHEITPAGRIKATSRRSFVERILSAWESLLDYVIKKSFEACAVPLPIDGSEEEIIHFFKGDGLLSDGKKEFTERVATFFNALEQPIPVNESGLFADLELWFTRISM